MSLKDRDNIKAESEEAKADGLDLGLSSLLDLDVKSTNLSDNQEAAVPQDLIQSQADPQIESDFDRLFKQESYSEIIRITEEKLEANNPEARNSSDWHFAQSWWLLAQVKSKSFPLAILEAPFDALLEARLTQFNISEVNGSEHIRVVNICDKAINTYIYSLIEQAENYTVVLQSILKLLGLTNLDRLNKQNIETQIQLISGRHESLKQQEKELLAQARLKLRLPRIQNEDPAKAPLQNTAPLTADVALVNKDRARKFVPLLMIVVLALAFLFVLFRSGATVPQTELAQLLINNVNEPKSRIELPAPAINYEVSALDLMLYEVKQKTDAKTESTGVYAETSQPPILSQQEKIKINTSEPKESDELRKLRTQKPADEPNQVVKDYSIVPGPAQAPQFREFENLRMYEVIKPTSLMTKPSTRAEAVAGLNKGDLVQVQAKEGYWLRVISKQGRIAYVIADDLQPAL